MLPHLVVAYHRGGSKCWCLEDPTTWVGCVPGPRLASRGLRRLALIARSQRGRARGGIERGRPLNLLVAAIQVGVVPRLQLRGGRRRRRRRRSVEGVG